jgi:cell division septation protein DedD
VSIPFHKQSQFELFPVNGSGRATEAPKPRLFFLKSLTLSLESAVVVAIMVMMAMVVSYCAGIERGKSWQVVNNRQVKKMVRKVQTPVVPLKAPAASVDSASVVKPALIPTAKTVTEAKPVAPATVPAVVEPATVAASNPDKALILTKPTESPAEMAAEIEKFYTIQVASYKGPKDANRAADLLKQKGYDILVVPKGAFSIVCVGKFKGKEEAKNFSQKLKKQYKDCLVRSM